MLQITEVICGLNFLLYRYQEKAPGRYKRDVSEAKIQFIPKSHVAALLRWSVLTYTVTGMMYLLPIQGSSSKTEKNEMLTSDNVTKITHLCYK